jgi:hypothetical protein
MFLNNDNVKTAKQTPVRVCFTAANTGKRHWPLTGKGHQFREGEREREREASCWIHLTQ